MRALKRFRGDLLLGGARLRGLDCELHDVPQDDDEPRWTGRFRVDRCEGSLMELGRPYLLQLTDGRSGHVTLSSVAADQRDTVLVVEFKSTLQSARS